MYRYGEEEPKQNPTIVAIVGSNHLNGFCDLLDNERIWSLEVMMEVVETKWYSRDHQYTKGLVRDVEEMIALKGCAQIQR